MKSFNRLFEAINNVVHSRNSYLQRKYMSWFMLIVLVPVMIIVSIIFTYSILNRNNQIKSGLSSDLNIAENILSTSLNSINTQATVIMINPSVTQAISADDPVDVSDHIVYAKNLLHNTTITNEHISSASIYSFHNDYFFGSNNGDYLHNFKNKNDIPWYAHYTTTGETDFIISDKNSNENHIYLSKSIYNGDKIVGLVIFHIDVENLFSFHDDKKYLIVSDYIGEVLFSHIPQYTGKKIYETDNCLSDFYFNDDSTIKITLKNSMAKIKLPYYNISLVTINQDASYSFLPTYIILLLLALIITTLVGFLFSVFLVDIFYSHIAKTISYLTTDSVTNYDSTQDELTWIKNRIYTILASNHELETELAQSITKLKDMHLVAMQIQSNPHFMFNALNLASMNAISELGLDNTTSKIIALISELIRTTLDTDEYFATIEDEVVFANKYMEIEKLKYGDIFDIEYDIDESVLHCKSVKITLQPFIENAFKHGIHRLPKSTRGLICISIKPHNNAIVFKIRDNGTADNDTIKEINKNLTKDIYSIPKHNIGLKNVNSRIKILFGEKYGCKIYRKNDMTVSEMVIPKKDIDEH